jgi:Tat protein translocase TatC
MTVGEHLEELRKRVIRSLLYLAAALVLTFVFNDYVLGFILKQPYDVLKGLGQDPIMPVLDPAEGFLTWLKVAFVTALIVASPLMAREVWGFVAAGLYPHEKKYVQIFAPISYFLFLGGVAFLYFLVLPTALEFLFSFGLSPHIPGVPEDMQFLSARPRFSSYVSFYLTMCVIMGIVFQLPLVMLFFMATGILKPSFFGKYRRHFIVGAVAVLAVITPSGDAPTLLLVSIPVLLLYEGGLLLGRVLLRRRKA